VALTGSRGAIAVDVALPRELERAFAEGLERAAAEDVAARIWSRDARLWGAPDAPELANRLGWLTIAERMRTELGELIAFARECAADGLTDAVVLGMGGSSLAPEVIRQTFCEPGGERLRLHVLDSTAPAAIASLEREIDLDRTLFVVSTKSGGTIETLSLFKYFQAQVADRVGRRVGNGAGRAGADARDEGGDQFVAITDPGSALAALAEQHRFRRTFLGDPEIGGRYSALSYFGLVPAALIGVDLDPLLDRAAAAAAECAPAEAAAAQGCGVRLGVAIAELALAGRDKLTLAVSPSLASFGLWAEQLIAESTGKQGKGIVPIVDEPIAAPHAYGDDRAFVYLRDGDAADPELDAQVEALTLAGQPTLTITIDGRYGLGSAFFLAEFATAVAGWALAINPFDQPDVQSAKDTTSRLLEGYGASGALAAVDDADESALSELVSRLGSPHYLAIMAYVAPSPALERAIAALRRAIRDATAAATTFGYGPRFLHSTGQLHKGGPPTGRFLQLVAGGDEDIEIPAAGYGFATLIEAQASGDLETLRARGLPVERVRLRGSPPRRSAS